MSTATVVAPLARRSSGECPASEGRGYRTPGAIHRPAGIMRHSNSRLGGGRSTPNSVAFVDPYGGQASTRRKPGVGVGPVTAARKRKQIVDVLDSITALVDGAVDERKPIANLLEDIPEENDAVGPVVRMMQQVAGGSGGSGAGGTGGHFPGGGVGGNSLPGNNGALEGAGPASPTRPASQRRRTESSVGGSGGGRLPSQQQDPPPPTQPQAQHAQHPQNGVSPGLQQSLRQTLAGWQQACQEGAPLAVPVGLQFAPPLEQLPTQQAQQQQQGGKPAAVEVGLQNQDEACPMQIEEDTKQDLVTPQRRSHKVVPAPPAMPAPPPSPYVPHAPPSQARPVSELAMASMQQMKQQQQQQQQLPKSPDWGDSSDDDDDVALAAVTKLEAVAAQHAQHATQQATQQPTSQAVGGSAGALPSLAGDRALVHYTVVAAWPNVIRPDGTSETQLQLHNPYTVREYKKYIIRFGCLNSRAFITIYPPLKFFTSDLVVQYNLFSLLNFILIFCSEF